MLLRIRHGAYWSMNPLNDSLLAGVSVVLACPSKGRVVRGLCQTVLLQIQRLSVEGLVVAVVIEQARSH